MLNDNSLTRGCGKSTHPPSPKCTKTVQVVERTAAHPFSLFPLHPCNAVELTQVELTQVELTQVELTQVELTQNDGERHTTMGQRKPTVAQIEAAKEKRAKVRAMLKKIANMTPTQQAELTSGQIATVAGRPLSFHNQCLVSMQGCKSTVVGGFRQWRDRGRIVRKGEHGFSIWIPSATKDEDTGKDDLRFFLGTVFGIDQTEEIEATL